MITVSEELVMFYSCSEVLKNARKLTGKAVSYIVKDVTFSNKIFAESNCNFLNWKFIK